MADNKGVNQTGFFKNITNKLPYQALDLNAVIGQLNPKYEIGRRRVGKECLRLCRSRWSPYH